MSTRIALKNIDPGYQVISDVPVFGEYDAQTFNQMKMCMEDAVIGVLMADHHLGYAQPIGGVVAYEGMISPIGVGYDIGCGNKAVKLRGNVHVVDHVRQNISKNMDEIYNSLSFGTGGVNKDNNATKVFDAKLDNDPAWAIDKAALLKDKARKQFGTIGSGNHYVDVFIDENYQLWIGVHFGSRGMGHNLATHFLKAAGQQQDMKPKLLDVKSDLGEQYLLAMHLAGKYAYAARDWVCQKVADIFGLEILEEIHNHHNFAWEEVHNGQKLWVVRKGATPAFPGQKGFVGGSMAEPAVIIEGIDSDEAKTALYSTVHGAGRVMSRTKATGTTKWGKVKGEGAVARKDMMSWVQEAGVELRGADVDEAPQCYKRLNEVLGYHSRSIRVLHTLRPIGVAMAGYEKNPEQ